MELLIGIIIWIIVMAMKSESNKTDSSSGVPENQTIKPAAQPVRQQTSTYQHNTARQQNWEKAARENIERGKMRAEQIKGKLMQELDGELGDVIKELDGELGGALTKVASRVTTAAQKSVATPQTATVQKADVSAMEQVRQRRAENRKTTILDRAKGNAAEEKADVTLSQLEEEHGHSAHVAPAVHHHPEDEIPENMLGSVEDLIVMGYDGKLCFERDFVGEGLDMISRFTVPSEIPDYSIDKVS